MSEGMNELPLTNQMTLMNNKAEVEKNAGQREN